MRTSAATVVISSLAAAAAAAALVASPGRALAGDGYCEHVEGVAAAESALLIAPELFASLGYVEQTAVIDEPDTTSDDVRFTAGLRFRLGGVYQGLITRKRASADCRRHQALEQVRGESSYRALAARAEVLDEALGEAEQMLAQANGDLEARRATAQEVTATRLRVDELRSLAARAHDELDALPAPAAGAAPGRALAAFYEADADVERQEGRLRRAAAWDLSVRVGYDKFLDDDDDESPYFAVVSASFNLGWFLQGGANARAAKGRRRAVEEETGGPGDASRSRVQALLDTERRREEETGVLVADLEHQLAQLERIGGDASRRHRQTVWFEWVKVKAEHAYLVSHVASLAAAMGEP